MVCGDAPQCRSLNRRQVRARATPEDRCRRRSRRATRRRPQCWPSRSAPSAGHAAGAPLWSVSGRARWRALRLARCPSLRPVPPRICYFRCHCQRAARPSSLGAGQAARTWPAAQMAPRAPCVTTSRAPAIHRTRWRPRCRRAGAARRASLKEARTRPGARAGTRRSTAAFGLLGLTLSTRLPPACTLQLAPCTWAAQLTCPPFSPSSLQPSDQPPSSTFCGNRPQRLQRRKAIQYVPPFLLPRTRTRYARVREYA